MTSSTTAVIAIDVGGTSMKGALVGDAGTLFAAGSRPTPQPPALGAGAGRNGSAATDTGSRAAGSAPGGDPDGWRGGGSGDAPDGWRRGGSGDSPDGWRRGAAGDGLDGRARAGGVAGGDPRTGASGGGLGGQPRDRAASGGDPRAGGSGDGLGGRAWNRAASGGDPRDGAAAGAAGGTVAGGDPGTRGAGGGDSGVGDDGGAVLAAILAYAEELAGEAGAVTGRAPVAAGLVVPGVLDEARGVAAYAANLGWRDVPLREAASRRLGLPVRIGHDVRTAALAESRFGAAEGQSHFLYLSIGTGIAGALFVDGRPYAGVSGRGGELGHAPVGVAVGGAPPEPCRCGQTGCLEAYASAAAVLRRYQARGGEPTLSTPTLVERAAAGTDPLAAAVWDEAVSALAVALAWYTMVLDPALVIIGGGLAEAGDALFTPLRAALATRLTWREPPRVEAGALGPSAGCLGAAVLAWRAVGRDLHTIAR